MLETATLVAAILGSLFYHKDTGVGKQHFGALPLAYQCWGPNLPTSQSAADLCPSPATTPGQAASYTGIQSHLPAGCSSQSLPEPPSCPRTWPHPPVTGSLSTRKGWQPTKQRVSHAYQHTHISQPATTEKPTQTTQESCLEHMLWWVEESVLLGPIGCFVHMATYPRPGNVTNLPNTCQINK